MVNKEFRFSLVTDVTDWTHAQIMEYRHNLELLTDGLGDRLEVSLPQDMPVRLDEAQSAILRKFLAPGKEAHEQP